MLGVEVSAQEDLLVMAFEMGTKKGRGSGGGVEFRVRGFFEVSTTIEFEDGGDPASGGFVETRETTQLLGGDSGQFGESGDDIEDLSGARSDLVEKICGADVRKSSVGRGGIQEKHVQTLGGRCDGAGVKPGYTIGTIRPLCGICP